MSRSRRFKPPTSQAADPAAGIGEPLLAGDAMPVDPPAASDVSLHDAEPALTAAAASEGQAQDMRSGTPDDEPALTERAAPLSTPAPAALAAPAPRSSSWPSALLGGVVGGLVAAGAGGWYLANHAPVPAPVAARLEAVEAQRARIEALGGELGALRDRGQAMASDLGALQSRLASKEAADAELPSRVAGIEQAARDLRGQLDGARASSDLIAGDVRGRLDELRARFDQIAGQVGGLASAGASSTAAAEQIARLDQAQGAVAQETAAAKARLDALTQEVARVGRETASLREAQTGLVAGGAETQRLAQEVRGLIEQQAVLAALAPIVAELRSGAGSERQAIAATQEGIVALRAEVAEALAAVEARLIARTADSQRAVGLATAVYELRSAAEAGKPLTDSLSLLRELTQGDEPMTALAQRIAAAGEPLPTLAELNERLDAVAAGAPSGGAQPAGGLAATRQNLGTLLTVRPSNGPRPADQAVVAARAALLGQDLPAAIAAVRPLVDGNKGASDWLELAERRQAVSQAIDELASLLKTRLAQGG